MKSTTSPGLNGQNINDKDSPVQLYFPDFNNWNQ